MGRSNKNQPPLTHRNPSFRRWCGKSPLGSPLKAPRESPAWSGRTLRCGAFSEAELGKLTAREAPADLVEARKWNRRFTGGRNTTRNTTLWKVLVVIYICIYNIHIYIYIFSFQISCYDSS